MISGSAAKNTFSSKFNTFTVEFARIDDLTIFILIKYQKIIYSATKPLKRNESNEKFWRNLEEQQNIPEILGFLG